MNKKTKDEADKAEKALVFAKENTVYNEEYNLYEIELVKNYYGPEHQATSAQKRYIIDLGGYIECSNSKWHKCATKRQASCAITLLINGYEVFIF